MANEKKQQVNDDDEEDVEQEPPPGMLPSGKLNIVNEDDPPFVPRIIPDEEFVGKAKAYDSLEFKESDHPRRPDGKFGSGGGSSSGAIKANRKVNPSAENVEPLHEVQDDAKFEDLVVSMKDGGWKGRPVVVFEGAAGIMGLTGSHRIAAAKEAGVDIPIYEVDKDAANFVDEDGNNIMDFAGTGDDQKLAEFLEQAGDEDAASLIREEILANAEENKGK